MDLSAASFSRMTVDDVGRRVWIAGDRVYPDGSRDGELIGVLYGGGRARRHVGSWAAPSTTGDDGTSVRARAAASSSRVARSTASR